MSKENPMICDNHLDISMIASEIMKLTNNPEILIRAAKIQSCAKDAMKQGQHMEKRLKRYHDSMLRLGFERVRR